MTQLPPFDVRTAFTAGALVVTVSGEVDMLSAPRIEEAIAGAADRAHRVVIDLSDVTFLDSTGLNALLRTQRSLTDRGIVLRLVAPATGIVRRLFEISNLLEPLNVVASHEEALS